MIKTKCQYNYIYYNLIIKNEPFMKIKLNLIIMCYHNVLKYLFIN